MKRVATHELLAEIGHLKNLLEQAGIPCVVKNEQLSGGLGEIPFIDCIPELWVVRDGDLQRARAIVDKQWRSADESTGWRCRNCGESNEGQFSACWQCGEADGDG